MPYLVLSLFRTMEDQNATPVHQFTSDSSSKKLSVGFFVAILVGAMILGGGVGYFLTAVKSSSLPSLKPASKPKQSLGVFDKKRFPDKTEGVLKEGGIDGEGNFHLVRPGGESQNVYLTSSIVDLSQFIGKKVRVWGETFKAEKAGWLMDVGYVEVL